MLRDARSESAVDGADARPNLTAQARLAAVLALVFGVATAIVGAIAISRNFPHGLFAAACVALGVLAGWYGIRRRGAARVAGLALSCLLLAGVLLLLLARDPLLTVLVVVGAGLTLSAASVAFRVRLALPEATPPRRPALFYNPKSGGGKATRFDLPAQARARGIEPIELTPGSDLEVLVRDAIARGVDGLAMAGGDGSQAIVATIAAEQGLPYACIPAGTRNHFALDLGVDREDVVGALDAFVDGGERLVDLAEVNGRVFVNNVSLGLYADAVARPGYREAKLRTILATVPDTLGPGEHGANLRWTGPAGARQRGGVAILVSNNRYRLGRAVGSGTRPHLDDGVLGVAVVGLAGEAGDHRHRPWTEWTTREFEIESEHPIAAGIDGEAVTLASPLCFRSHPMALRARLARRHPGASPSALEPEGLWEAVRALAAIAAGRDRRPLPQYVERAPVRT